jgi:hypothetical protein
MSKSGWATLLTLLVLGACAPRPVPIVLTPQAPPAGTDGRYRGIARLIRGDRACPRSGPRVYDVENATVTVAYSGNRATSRSTPARVQISATVQPDGTLQASDGVGTIEGRLQDGTLEFTIASPACEHRWALRRVN